MQRKHWLLLSTAVVVTLGLGVAITRSTRFQNWWHPPTLELPSDEDVIEMRASLRDFHEVWQAVPEFTVPAEHVPVILDWLRPATYNSEPWPMDRRDELGEITIHTRHADEFRMQFYWTGVNPVVFTRNGVDQFYGKSLIIEEHGVDGGLSLYNEIRQAAESEGRRHDSEQVTSNEDGA